MGKAVSRRSAVRLLILRSIFVCGSLSPPPLWRKPHRLKAGTGWTSRPRIPISSAMSHQPGRQPAGARGPLPSRLRLQAVRLSGHRPGRRGERRLHRRLPKSDSSQGWGTGDDAQTIAETLRLLREETAVDPARIAVSGHSAGGAYAYLLAYTTRSQYSAVFTLAAPLLPGERRRRPRPTRRRSGCSTARRIPTTAAPTPLKMQWNRLGVPSEDDIRAGLGTATCRRTRWPRVSSSWWGKSYPLSRSPGPARRPRRALSPGRPLPRRGHLARLRGKTGVGSVVPGGRGFRPLLVLRAGNWE